MKTEKPLTVFPSQSLHRTGVLRVQAGEKPPLHHGYDQVELGQVLGRVGQHRFGFGCPRVMRKTVADPAFETSPARGRRKLDLHPFGDGIPEVVIDRLAIAGIGLERDQMVDLVAEQTARQREMLSQPLLNDPFLAVDGLGLELQIVVVEGSEVRRDFEGLGGAESRPV